MKKLFVLLLSAVMLFSFVACSKKETSEFKKPENYATVVLVTINPEFRLYLDAEGRVLAVEPVNADAKSIADKISLDENSMEKVVGSLVIAVNDGGFIKDGEVKVDLSVEEVKDEAVDTETVLQAAKTAVDSSFTKLEIEAEVIVNQKYESESPTSQSEITSSEEHVHEFAPATCASPKTCACGATEGKELGHKYSGEACSVCGAENPNYKTPLEKKGGSWTGMFWINGEAGKTVYDITINLSENLITGGGGGLALEILGGLEYVEEAKKNGEAFYFDGEWWVGGFGGLRAEIQNISENGNTIKITTDDGTVTLTRTAENTMKVESSSAGLMTSQGIKAGTVFTLEK